jgi:predicted house-cleaning noncanonical NTP pyrophosphatase (MazG superfamily)
VPRLTPGGRDAASRLADARREEVRAIVDEWKPEEQPDVRRLIDRIAEAMGSAPPLVVTDAR